jgi:NIPSNAP
MNLHASTNDRCCPVIELRQYTLKPGQRDTLINLFDRYFVESQEATGMTIIGQFRDRERPDRFVWMRGFADMESRHRALEQFYSGPVWMAHRAAANDTMIDSDDVLLLRPVRANTSFVIERGPTGDQPATDVLIGLYSLQRPEDEALVAGFEREVVPRLRAQGVHVTAMFMTETARNTFAQLPVREDEQALMWVGSVRRAQLSRATLREIATASILEGARAAPTLLNLEPTSRSWLGGGSHAARASMHDFDFLHGSWKVHNRYLKGRLQGSTEWIEFDARSDAEPALNGLAQIDRYNAVRDGVSVDGLTVRLFNPATGEWALYWADTVRAGVLQPPMVGRFTGGLGEFFGDETVDGKKVLCRFHWTRMPDGMPRWEQAFSDDGGKTWETNWIMTLTRR